MDAPPEEELPPDEAELEEGEEEGALYEDEPDGGGDLSYAAMFASSALSKLGLGGGGAPGDPALARDAAAADPQVAAPGASRRRDEGGLAQGRQVCCGTWIGLFCRKGCLHTAEQTDVHVLPSVSTASTVWVSFDYCH